MNRKFTAIAGALIVIVITLTGCDSGKSANAKDRAATNTQLDRYQRNQPIPQADWSQYRQTLLDVENAQIHGIATTTFFYNMGSNVPVKSCPSLGYPVASTANLTNPLTPAGYQDSSTVAQMEPTGVFTGDSTGTYIACVSSAGTPYVTYWEGFVEAEGAPAHFDKTSGQIVLDGAPTVPTKSAQ